MPDGEQPNWPLTYLASQSLGLWLHTVWMLYVAHRWGRDFLPWPDTSDGVAHRIIFVMPRTGWDVDSLATGFAGVVFPLLLPVFGYLYFKLRGPGQPKNSLWFPMLCCLLAIALVLNSLLLFYFFVLEDY